MQRKHLRTNFTPCHYVSIPTKNGIKENKQQCFVATWEAGLTAWHWGSWVKHPSLKVLSVLKGVDRIWMNFVISQVHRCKGVGEIHFCAREKKRRGGVDWRCKKKKTKMQSNHSLGSQVIESKEKGGKKRMHWTYNEKSDIIPYFKKNGTWNQSVLLNVTFPVRIGARGFNWCWTVGWNNLTSTFC